MQKSRKYAPLFHLTLLLLLFVLWLAAGYASASNTLQDLKQLENAVSAAVVGYIVKADGTSAATGERAGQHLAGQHLKVSVSNIDPRLRLSECSEAIHFDISATAKQSANASVKVLCKNQTPWALVVPVAIKEYRDIPVAARDIYRGEILQTYDIHQKRVDVRRIRFGERLSLRQIIGKVSKRRIAEGTPLRSSFMEAPIAVSRGDRLHIESNRNGLIVAAKAVAMGKGRIGDTIRVKNSASQRVLDATVVAPGRVVTR